MRDAFLRNAALVMALAGVFPASAVADGLTLSRDGHWLGIHGRAGAVPYSFVFRK